MRNMPVILIPSVCIQYRIFSYTLTCLSCFSWFYKKLKCDVNERSFRKRRSSRFVILVHWLHWKPLSFLCPRLVLYLRFFKKLAVWCVCSSGRRLWDSMAGTLPRLPRSADVCRCHAPARHGDLGEETRDSHWLVLWDVPWLLSSRRAGESPAEGGEEKEVPAGDATCRRGRQRDKYRVCREARSWER